MPPAFWECCWEAELLAEMLGWGMAGCPSAQLWAEGSPWLEDERTDDCPGVRDAEAAEAAIACAS